MPAINGNQYTDRINHQHTSIWYDGKPITGKLSEHPAFKGIIQSQANLYNVQLEKKDLMTYPSPLTGEPVGASYMQPKTKEDLIKRREMIQTWAKKSGGLLGRSPDYMNTVLMALASSSKLLANKPNCFPENLVRFYEKAREEDLSFTHTFINPQVNRSQLYFEDTNKPIAAKIIKETDKGMIIDGARLLATQGGITDEILVFSPGGITDQAHAFFFSIPSDIDGLKFICRESFVGGDSTFNYPLSSRFEEMDTIVVFDHVLVPWERVFFYKNIDVANSFKNQSGFLPFTLHQAVARQVVKAELMLGVAQAIVDTINISEYQHVQEKVSEIIVYVETMRGLLLKSESNAQMDSFGLMRPEQEPLQAAICTFPKIYPKMSEIVQFLGSSGMVSIPTEADFQSEIRDDLDHYLQATTKKAHDRVKLFRLAWDLTMSGFGTRQTQYERFFFGNPIRLSTELYHFYDKATYVRWVESFLDNNG
ncbi:4-hydroxyphenylacetate 3-monooxygenase, oxygenase component [Aquibacillus koreensis]|uniref:4-hydroxyphenylacetate 3-monooxygenase, oxygenase component n=1 Tax=Aquibacillus koreensis TaxID=279446 RepID=A0A9X3WID0_9BACI|nr:4-hydroxyphenylacetate 3-monooxygenase, oxygenase component [Aquibacillus koreensis]MCT2535820.1 4-hydroxyphenylacetate 3-monooxygenase, oxygenase component [Aquibacillus koreensis]MDC3420275.1 4-hydroxyphenylacetate 3-monooxygenase, oxygenase component [Aquibacillus koreensis]